MKKEVIEHIKEYEGFSSLAYECTAGYTTIGYGRNIEQKGITKEEMMEAVHVGAAIESGATLVHGVQMMNKYEKLSM